MIPFMNEYTAAIQKDGKFWIGWIEEAQQAAGDDFEEVRISA